MREVKEIINPVQRRFVTLPKRHIVIELLEVRKHVSYSPFPQTAEWRLTQRWMTDDGLHCETVATFSAHDEDMARALFQTHDVSTEGGN